METITKRLETEFTGIGEVKGFIFTQKHINTSAYMYEVDKGGGNIHFEVFKRLDAPLCLDFKKHFYSKRLFKVRYPKSKAFGSWAWTFTNYDKALDKFNELCKKP